MVCGSFLRDRSWRCPGGRAVRFAVERERKEGQASLAHHGLGNRTVDGAWRQCLRFAADSAGCRSLGKSLGDWIALTTPKRFIHTNILNCM